MRLFYILFFAFITSTTFGQNFIYNGNKAIPSTQTWFFTLNKSNLWACQLLVSVGKSKAGGYLMLSVGTANKGESISKNVFIILKDGSTISLSNKVATDYLDEKSQVLYSITPSQLSKLKSSNIDTIRFFVTGTSIGMAGSHSASNIRMGDRLGTYEPGWETALEISDIK